MANDGPSGGRWIEVAPDRLPRWLESFAHRHGGTTVGTGPDTVTFRAADGAVAECHIPFPPLRDGPPAAGRAAAGASAGGLAAGAVPESPKAGRTTEDRTAEHSTPEDRTPEDRTEGGSGPAAEASAEYGRLIAAHACADRTVAVFLVRLGGYAAGIFTGPAPSLAASKVGSRLVHGRSAAGGTSQHRFARRREKQAAEALGAAADTAAAVFGPYAGRIDAVVLGGDRRAMASLREDPRLAPYFGLAVERFLTVPDPRLTVLRSTPRLFRAIRIRLTGPAG